MFPAAILKSNKEQVNILFNPIHLKIIILTCNIKILMTDFTFFFVLILQNLVYTLHFIASQFALATFQVFKSHTC